jgi:predicted nuclease with TOPRIM domain
MIKHIKKLLLLFIVNIAVLDASQKQDFLLMLMQAVTCEIRTPKEKLNFVEKLNARIENQEHLLKERAKNLKDIKKELEDILLLAKEHNVDDLINHTLIEELLKAIALCSKIAA